MAALRAREQERERARRDAERRREAAWREREAARRRERWLDRAFRRCPRHAHLDLGAPTGPDWLEQHPEFRRNWPRQRPPWWLPPPGMLERR